MDLGAMRDHLSYIESIGMPLEPQHFLYLAQREAREGNVEEAREVFKKGSRLFLLSPQIWCGWGMLEQLEAYGSRACILDQHTVHLFDHGRDPNGRAP